MRAVLSIGGNIGEVRATLVSAVRDLPGRGVTVDAVSSLYRTPPWGPVAQGDFLNAVVLVRTDLKPRELLDVCRRVEADHHRTREVRWGPRTLDVDIVAAGEVVSDDPELTLPHPRAHERAFVLVPWLEIDPDAALPQGTVRELVASLPADETGSIVRVAGQDWCHG